MKAEQLTASLENCQKLVGLGVTVDSYFFHVRHIGLRSEHVTHDHPLTLSPAFEITAPAPTLSELLEVAKRWEFVFYNTTRDLNLFRGCLFVGDNEIETESTNPANALILCIIEAIKEGHITAKQINGGE